MINIKWCNNLKKIKLIQVNKVDIKNKIKNNIKINNLEEDKVVKHNDLFNQK